MKKTLQKQHRILVVEDDATYSNVYQLKLTNEGFLVDIADSGDTAMQTLAQHMPDLILLDLMLPHIDGFGFLEMVKGDKKYKHIPVVVFSNLGQPEDVKRVTSLGAAAYYVKANLSIHEMVEHVKKYLA